MTPTPSQLLRLYPGRWRLRYGAEFLALLETTPVTRGLVRDVVRAAANEWLTRTRVGRVLIGATAAAVATVCAMGLAQIISSRGIAGQIGFSSFWSLGFLLLYYSWPMLVGTLLVVAHTDRRRRFAWLGLRHQLTALFLSSLWAQWLEFGSLSAALDRGRIVEVWFQGAFYLTFWLMLLYNVDRSREGAFQWPRVWPGPSSDRY